MDEIIFERGKKYAEKQGIDFDNLSYNEQQKIVIKMLQESISSDNKTKKSKSFVKNSRKKSFWGQVSDTINTLTDSADGNTFSSTTNCIHCLSNNPANSTFCNNCGKKLS